MKAREAYAAGRYQEALDLFAKLYAESLNPIYLRNTGRCHQNLGDPDPAIASFRDYLRKASKLSAAERKEIEGYIKEMEELKRQKEASATSAPPPRATPVEPVTPLPREAPPTSAPGGSSATASVVMTPPPRPPAEEPSPIYGRWWFWAIVGGVVATGLGVAFAAGAFTRTEDATCPDLTKCSP